MKAKPRRALAGTSINWNVLASLRPLNTTFVGWSSQLLIKAIFDQIIVQKILKLSLLDGD